jgi:hypothetical protein
MAIGYWAKKKELLSFVFAHIAYYLVYKITLISVDAWCCGSGLLVLVDN